MDKQLQLIYIAYGTDPLSLKDDFILICWHADPERASVTGQLIAQARALDFIGVVGCNNGDCEAPVKLSLWPKPKDLSGVVRDTDKELQRLGWTTEQYQEHLIKTYNKRGRTLLTEEEMVDFLQFLQSQP